MARNRAISRERKKNQRTLEEPLDRKNLFGISDPTPYQAMDRIMSRRSWGTEKRKGGAEYGSAKDHIDG